MSFAVDDKYFRPGYGALLFLVIGVVWLPALDFLVFIYVQTPRLAVWFHLIKGFGFVLFSGVILYWVSKSRNRRVRETTQELRETLQQTHVLHRILRHNLRNKCNVIVGHAETLRETSDSTAAATIKQTAEELLEMSEQSRVLREVSLGDQSTREIDLVETVHEILADLADTNSPAQFRTQLPAEATVTAHPDIRYAIREVILNAIEHGKGTVGVHIETSATGEVSVVVTDAGTGFPPLERRVLEEGFIETQMRHSQGLGLWIVRSLLNASDGTLSIESGPESKTTVRLTFHSTVKVALRQFLE